ncbi:MAG: glycosyl transferase family 2 [Fibrobacter sp.]|nr:glycosyl transferase family 2 [Fibrobacter sp.]
MNFEKVNVLSQKIEGVLGTVRALKEENAKLKQQLSASQASFQDKAMLLEKANASIVDYKAALNARENEAIAQTQSLNVKEIEIAGLNEKMSEKNKAVDDLKAQIELLNCKVQEKDNKLQQSAGLLQESANRLQEYQARIQEDAAKLDACDKKIQECEARIQDDEGKFQEFSSQLDTLNSQVGSLNQQINDKLVTIANLTEQLNGTNQKIEELNAIIAEKNELLQAQADEIDEAQEKFQQLVSTIENELGTDLPIEQEELSEDMVDDVVEETAAEDVAQESAEEELPTIEVHPASEKKTENSASNKEGSQTSFFRLNWLLDEDPFGVGSK